MRDTCIPASLDLFASGDQQEAFHQRAAAITRERFGRDVFVRAVVEISNYCRENCQYCGMRRDNRQLDRYRARWGELAELLIHHRPASVTDVNIQAGEDPIAVREVALPLIKALRHHSGIGISVCLGTLTPEMYRDLKAAGATIYILKFETATPDSYAAFHAPGNLEERTEHIRWLAQSGWKVSSGFIAGLPSQTESDLIEALKMANDLPLKGCSVSPFIPGEDTPLAGQPVAKADVTLNCMAAMRLMRPEWIIPAVSALNLSDPSCGYRRGLRAGANLVTINLTPPEMRNNYLLYKRNRFIMTEERILTAIDLEGLKPSTQSLQDFYLSQPNGYHKNGASKGLRLESSANAEVSA